MKILEVITEVPPVRSGVARVAGELIEGFQQRGHTVDTLSARSIWRLDIGEFRLSTMLFQMLRLYKHWKLDEYDIINVHGPAPSFSEVFLLFVLLLRRLGRHKATIIYTYHSEIYFARFDWLCHIYNRIQKWLARFCDHTIVTTPSYADKVGQYLVQPETQLSVIPWGAEVSAYQEQPKAETFRLIMVGQLRPYKGTDVILRAMSHLPQVHLDIVGRGHAEAQYRRLAKKLNLTNVTFWGAVPDAKVFELMARSHVLVLPSLTQQEAFGIVLIEAMALGCVPVASDLPGVRDVIGKVGLTFPIGNSAALARVIASLVEKPAVWQWRSQQARLRAVNYSWQRVVETHEQLYSYYHLRNRLADLVQNGSSFGVALTDLLASLVLQMAATGATIEAYPYLAQSTEPPEVRRLASFGSIKPLPVQTQAFVATLGKTIILDEHIAQTYLDVGYHSPEDAPQIVAALGRGYTLRIQRSQPFTQQEKDWLHRLAAGISYHFEKDQGDAQSKKPLQQPTEAADSAYTSPAFSPKRR